MIKMVRKISEAQVNAYLEDELKAHEEYNKIGATSLAKDELRHYHYWLRRRKEWYGY